tara:strand:- start:283 stop:942 length:660 start_codon:yes stop_codon:yes gene_type:complete
MSFIKYTLSVMLFCLFAPASLANLMVFTDQGQFQIAVSGGASTTFDFDAPVDPFSYFTLDYQDEYGSSTGVVDSGFDTTSGANYLGLDIGLGFLAGGDFTLTFNQTWHAIGLYLIASDTLFDDDAILNVGTGSVGNIASATTALSDGGQAIFIGLVDTAGFTSATLVTYLDANFGQGVFEFAIDDLQLVSLAPAPVPEPPTLALFALALLTTWRLKHKQ